MNNKTIITIVIIAIAAFFFLGCQKDNDTATGGTTVNSITESLGLTNTESTTTSTTSTTSGTRTTCIGDTYSPTYTATISDIFSKRLSEQESAANRLCIGKGWEKQFAVLAFAGATPDRDQLYYSCSKPKC